MRRFIVPVGLVVAGIAVGLVVDPTNERFAAAVFGASLALALGWIALRHWAAIRAWRRPIGLIAAAGLALVVGMLAIGSTASALVAVGIMPEPTPDPVQAKATTTPAPSVEATEVAMLSPTATPTLSTTASLTATPRARKTPSPTVTPTASPTPSPTPTPTPRRTATPTPKPTATPDPQWVAFRARVMDAAPLLRDRAEALLAVLDSSDDEVIDEATGDLFNVVDDEQVWLLRQDIGWFSCLDGRKDDYTRVLRRYERPTELVWESLPARRLMPEDWASTVDAAEFHVAEGAKEMIQLLDDLDGLCA